MQQPARPHSAKTRGLEISLLVLIAVLLGSHFLHLAADPATRMGWRGPVDWSGDLFTDEGWASAAAVAQFTRGHWYQPGDFNLAVNAPMWPALLYVSFKIFGLSIVVARAVAAALYVAAVGLVYVFVRRDEGRWVAAASALLLAADFMAMTFSRLAMLEAAWIFWLMASLVVSQKAKSRWIVLAGGALLGLAMLTKLTAICGLAPLLLMLFCERTSVKEFFRRAAAACAGAASIVVPYKVIANRIFPLDCRLYTQINVSDRAVHGMRGLLHEALVVVRAAPRLDVALYTCVAIGALLAIATRGRKRWSAVEACCLTWLAMNVAVCATVTYLPPRYCVSLLLPATVLAVIWTHNAMTQWKWAGYGLAGVLGISFLLNAGATLRYELHPVYSFRAISNAIDQQARQAGQSHVTVMGTFADTVSLYTGMPAVNDDLGTSARLQRIEMSRPGYYLSAGPAKSSVLNEFAQAGAELDQQQKFDVLQNYSTHLPAYLYAIRWHDVRPVEQAVRQENVPAGK